MPRKKTKPTQNPSERRPDEPERPKPRCRPDPGRFDDSIRLVVLLTDLGNFTSASDLAHRLCDVVAEMKRRGNACDVPGEGELQRIARELVAVAKTGNVPTLVQLLERRSDDSIEDTIQGPEGRREDNRAFFECGFFCVETGLRWYLRERMAIDIGLLEGVEEHEGRFFDPRRPLRKRPALVAFPEQCRHVALSLRDAISARVLSGPPLCIDIRWFLRRCVLYDDVAPRLGALPFDLNHASDAELLRIAALLEEIALAAAFDAEPRFLSSPPTSALSRDERNSGERPDLTQRLCLDPTDKRIIKYLFGQSARRVTPDIAEALRLNKKSIGKNLSRLATMRPPLIDNRKRIGYALTQYGLDLARQITAPHSSTTPLL